MKSIWKGSISFGLVNIPVKMFSATRSHNLDLDLLHKGDLCEIKYKRVCKNTGKEVPWEDIVKGYKYKGGDYIVLTDKDFKSADIEKTSTIDLVHFVYEKEIDTIYYEKPYYLEPEKAGMKAYTLLRDAIKKTKKAGIARFVIKNREHIGVIKPYKEFLIIEQLRFEDEIRSTDGLIKPAVRESSAKEIEIAMTLIKQISNKFNPKEYKDTYIDALKKIIEQKAKGKRIIPKGKTPETTSSKNLMRLLKKSIAA